MEYFHLNSPRSEQLHGDPRAGYKNRETAVCPLHNRPGDPNRHSDRSRRIGPLLLHAKHNLRDQQIIWSYDGIAIHEKLLWQFEREGFTGYRLKPATVTFRDGSSSADYRELIVTGWAGIARPESGVRVEKSCPACLWKQYTMITNHQQLIDWSQWTGEDFFMVWPIPKFVLITSRVAKWLTDHNIKSFYLDQLENLNPFVAKLGFTVGRLSNFLPEDLAIKYGRQHGLE